MSITQAASAAPEMDPSSWTPEVNDLQKYRDSLKVMAERVSQAEYMWARSLEPPEAQFQPAQPKHVRKSSRSKKPAPLKRPVTPKRIRTDDGMYSPDPFQLLSSSAFSEDAISPKSAPVIPQAFKSTRRSKRFVDGSPVEQKGDSAFPVFQSIEDRAERQLRQAEKSLKDAIRIAEASLESATDSSETGSDSDSGSIIRRRRTLKKARNAGIQAQGLVAEAQLYSAGALSDASLTRNPLEDISKADWTTGSKELLSDVASRLRNWLEAMIEARKKIAVNEDTIKQPLD